MEETEERRAQVVRRLLSKLESRDDALLLAFVFTGTFRVKCQHQSPPSYLWTWVMNLQMQQDGGRSSRGSPMTMKVRYLHDERE